jgi:hypothetical protein
VKADVPPADVRSLNYGIGGNFVHAGDTSRISTDAAATFADLVLPGTTTGIEIRRTASGMLWLLAEDGSLDHVYTSTDNGATWTLRADFALSAAGLQQMGAHPTDNLHAARSFVTGGGNGKVWFTVDGGVNWQQDGVTDPGVGSMSLWFWTNTGRLIAAQQYSTGPDKLIIRYSDTPTSPTFFATNVTAYTENPAGGVAQNRWMLVNHASGPIFLGLSLGGTTDGTRVLRSNDNGSTWVAAAVTPWVYPTSGEPRGIAYDVTGDILYLLFQGSGQVFSLPTASSRDFTTLVLGDWTELPPVPGGGLASCVDVLAFLPDA